MKELIFATHNNNKAIEIQAILGDGYRIMTLDQAGITEDVPEEQDTLEGNALQKAKYVQEKIGMDCFADDTGLEVDALGGEPGVYSARYAELSDERFEGEEVAYANMRKLLRRLEGQADRRARFRTIIALVIEGDQYTFEGVVEGSILSGKRGDKGFGYDPVFLPDGFDKTFAEMSLVEKNMISHRSKAVEKLAEFLKNS
jgi:XTP/dITP diphosphohydrolase